VVLVRRAATRRADVPTGRPSLVGTRKRPFASRFGVPHADPLAGRRRKELDERRRSAPSHVYERIGPVRLRPVYRVEELGRGSQLRVSQRDRDHRRVCVISVCCIHPNFLSGLSGEVRHSKAGGYSSLAYRLVGYVGPVRAGRVSHRDRYRSTCLCSTSATGGVAHLGKRGRPCLRGGLVALAPVPTHAGSCCLCRGQMAPLAPAGVLHAD
jgi:hypothetical protein